MPKRNLLFIPHTAPATTLVTRGEALARGMADDFNVHLLSWHHDPLEQASPHRRLISRLLGLTRRLETHSRDGITVIVTPFLYIRRSGTEAVRQVNTIIVNRIVKQLGIDAVVNELALVNSRGLSAPHILDIVDLPIPRELRRWAVQADKAAGITTITAGLAEALGAYGMAAEVIGNGADLVRFRAAGGELVRSDLGLGGRYVIGHIGNHAEWSGLPFLLDIFKKVKVVMPEAALLIVGPGSEIPRARAKVSRERIDGVIFTGPVEASDVPAYFKALDLAVLPFGLDPHANLSFPIKVIEYSAARKSVVATPIRVLRELDLPNVRLVDPDTDQWADAIVGHKATQWQDAWDERIEEFDWRNLAGRMAAFIRARLA
jgi:glycosyltransferase involved in cell wall biosynthesis